MGLNKIWTVIWTVCTTGRRGAEFALHVYMSNLTLWVDVCDKKTAGRRRHKKQCSVKAINGVQNIKQSR
jgi:hypothetical protein